MKCKIVTIVIFAITSLSVNAKYVDTLPENVRSIKEKSSGALKVKCVDKSQGIISFEESNICTFSKNRTKKRCEETFDANQKNIDCTFSKKNLKNRCENDIDWTVKEAAQFICQK